MIIHTEPRKYFYSLAIKLVDNGDFTARNMSTCADQQGCKVCFCFPFPKNEQVKGHFTSAKLNIKRYLILVRCLLDKTIMIRMSKLWKTDVINISICHQQRGRKWYRWCLFYKVATLYTLIEHLWWTLINIEHICYLPLGVIWANPIFSIFAVGLFPCWWSQRGVHSPPWPKHNTRDIGSNFAHFQLLPISDLKVMIANLQLHRYLVPRNWGINDNGCQLFLIPEFGMWFFSTEFKLHLFLTNENFDGMAI